MKYTANTLKKLEGFLETQGFTIRYEKGNFQAGYCILEDRKVIVVNKYFDITARINSLMDIILQACGTQEVWPDWLSALYRKTVEHEG